jgi:hypothetical protein
LKQDIPFDIPAGTTVELECELEAGQPGPFESQMHIHVYDLGYRELIMTVHGKAGGE